MKNSCLYFFAFFFLLSVQISAQEDSLQLQTRKEVKLKKNRKAKVAYNALAPAKAAFYSAVLPGLGQAYNKSYWKIPIVYAGLGAGVYFYTFNNREYNRFRDAYKRRLAGYTDDEFQDILTDKTLIDAQKQFRRQKEMSVLAMAALYVLNIIDANVDAHLRQFNVDEDLSLQPNFNVDEFTGRANYGLSLNLKF
ncbi:MAG: DUF5683 domain-containing protein [Mesonia sp.]